MTKAMVQVYGIPNCDSVKAATRWLQEHNIKFEFHDFKKEGISAARLQKWISIAGLQQVFNTRSSTWKQMQPKYPGLAITPENLIPLMIENTSIIKRPVMEFEGKIITGFKENVYIENLLHHS